MRAAVLEQAPGGLHIEEIPIPEPLDGEVLVKVTACGVCHTDLHVMKAEVAFPTPAVLGHEISGTIVELGAGVAGPPVGHACRLGVHHAVRPLPAVRDRARRSVRQLFRDEPPARHALRRHVAAAPRGRHAARDVLDGRPRRVRGRARRPTSSRCPPACRSRNRRCWAARCSRRTAPSATAPTCAAASASRSSPPAASA